VRLKILGENGRPVPAEEQEQPAAAEEQEQPLTPNRRGPAHWVPDLTKLPAETKRRLDAEGVRRRGG